MRTESELQYADFHPGQVEKIGQIDLDQALKLITAYPWEREFDKIEARTREDLTSTVPNITFRNRDNEVLVVSARDKESFVIQFMTPTHRGELILPNNSFENRHGFTTREFVSTFYNGTIRSIIELKPIERLHSDDEGTIFRLREWPIVTLGAFFVLMTLILVLDFWTNGFTERALPAVYFVSVCVLASVYYAVLIIQYTLTDWGKEISFGQNGELTIRQQGKEILLKKGEIDHVVIVEFNYRRGRGYRYARIRTKDQQSFIVTSFIIEPSDLIDKLGVNYKDEFMLVPTINYDIMSERQKERLRRFKEKKKNEFLENFKEYDDSKLGQIVRDKQNYADYAVEAATEILERRKNIKV